VSYIIGKHLIRLQRKNAICQMNIREEAVYYTQIINLKNKRMNPDNYLVFDLGYSITNQLDGLAVLHIINGEIENTYHRELTDEFNYRTMKSMDLKPVYQEIWESIEEMVKSTMTMVCMKASVHKTSFVDTFSQFFTEMDNVRFLDVNNIAINRRPGLEGYSRELLAKEMELELYLDYGKELREAVFTYEVLQKLLNEGETVSGVLERYAEKKKENESAFFRKTAESADTSGLKWDIEVTTDDFKDKTFVVTGEFEHYPGKKRKQLEELLQTWGGLCRGSISSKTDIAVIGSGAGPKKVEQVKDLQAKGHHIKVVSEDVLNTML
jgi:NAD-dependent DNA ligase